MPRGSDDARVSTWMEERCEKTTMPKFAHMTLTVMPGHDER